MTKAERSLRKMASLGTAQMQHNGVTLITTSHGLTKTQGAYGLLWAQIAWTHSVTRAQHSIWTVVLSLYNLPPWLCKK
jgi:hypothetical protein